MMKETTFISDERLKNHNVTIIVLVAEDEASIATLLADMVEAAGGTPLVAENGQKALELARSYPPVLVVTDLMMPVMDGATLARALRHEAALQGRSAPPIILVTAAGSTATAAVGADVIVHKPFELDDFELLLRHYLADAM